MKLTLKRINFTDTYTEGELYINDELYCNTLEDKNRDLNKNGVFDNGEKKVYSQTCIPFGTYNVKITWSPKFKRFMPEITNVPQFTGIRVHLGLDEGWSSGCVLIGDKNGDGKLKLNKELLFNFEKIIKKEIEDGGSVILDII